MSAINERGISHIQDEDLLKKMWQETEDFGRKKEIRAHMYKLREERLKDLYCNTDVKDVHVITNKKTSFNQSMHADALADHSFASLKRKEIRDSESPTKEVSYRMKGPTSNEGWNISKIEEHSQDGKNHRFVQKAHTSGTEYIPKGKLDFEVKNSQEVTSHQEGDQNNFVKSQGSSSTSFIRQEAVGGDDNSNFRSSSTQSSSSSRKVIEQKSTFGDAIDYPRAELVIEGANEDNYNNFRKSSCSDISSSKRVTSSDDFSNQKKQIIIESVGTDNQNNFRNLTSSKTTTEQKSFDDYSRKQTQISDEMVVDKTTKVYTTDAPRELKSHPGYVEGKTKITRVTKTLADGTVVTTTKYETSGANEVKSSSNHYTTSSSTFQDNKSNVVTKSHDEKYSAHKVLDDNSSPDKNKPKSRYYVEKTHTIPDTTQNVHHNVNSRRESKNFQSHVDVRNVEDTQNRVDTRNTEHVTKHHVEVDDRRKSNIDIQNTENVRKDVIERNKVQQKTVATHDINSVPLGTPIEIEINLTRITDNQRGLEPQNTPVYQEPQQKTTNKSPNVYDTPQRREPIKHESELNTKTTSTKGQYDTTYRTDYTNKKISVEVSPTHDAFARSLRAVSPDRLSSRTSSRNLKNSNSSLRSSSSPEKNYGHPQNGRCYSPTKKSPEKFSSTETITYKTTSKPSPQRISPDKNQKTKHTNDVRTSHYTTITRKTDKMDDKTYKRPQSPSKNVPRSSIPNDNKQYTNVFEITTDLDDTISTISHSTTTKNRTDSVHSIVDSKTNSENISTKEPSKKDMPSDKPLKRTDTYEERCRQILGITSDTNEKRRSSLEKLRRRGSNLASQAEPGQKTSPEKPTGVPRQKSPSKQGSPLQEFPAQIRRTSQSPEKKVVKEPSPTKDRKPSVERKPIQEYPSQHRKSPEKPDERVSPTRSSPGRTVDSRQERKPSLERTPIREYPSQTRKTPEKNRPNEQKVPSKTTDVDRQDRRPSTKPLGEYPSQKRPSPEKHERQSPNRQAKDNKVHDEHEVNKKEHTNTITNITNVIITDVSRDNYQNTPDIRRSGPDNLRNKTPLCRESNVDSSSEEDNSQVFEKQIKEEVIYDIPRSTLTKKQTTETETTRETDKNTQKIHSEKRTTDYISQDQQCTKNYHVETIIDSENIVDEREKEIPVYKTTEESPKYKKPKESSPSTKSIPAEKDQQKPNYNNTFDVEIIEQTEDTKTKTVGDLVKSFTLKEIEHSSEQLESTRRPTDKSPSSASPSRKSSQPIRKNTNEIEITESTESIVHKKVPSTLQRHPTDKDLRETPKKPQDSKYKGPEEKPDLPEYLQKSTVDIKHVGTDSVTVKTSPSGMTRQPSKQEESPLSRKSTQIFDSSIEQTITEDICKKTQQSKRPTSVPSKTDEIQIEVEEIIIIESDEELSPKQKPRGTINTIEQVEEIESRIDEDDLISEQTIEIDISTKKKLPDSRGPSEKTPVKNRPQKTTTPSKHDDKTKPSRDSVPETKKNTVTKVTEKKVIQNSTSKTRNIPKDKDSHRPPQRTPSSSSVTKKPDEDSYTKKKNQVPTRTTVKKPDENVPRQPKPKQKMPSEPYSDYSSGDEEEILTKKHVMETYEGRTPVEEPLVKKKSMSLLYSDDEDDRKTTQLLIESEITDRPSISNGKKVKPVETPKTKTTKLITSEKNEITTQKTKSPLKTSPQFTNKTPKKPVVEKKPEITKKTYSSEIKSNNKEITRKVNKQNTLEDIEKFENVTEDKTTYLRSNRVDDIVNKKKSTVNTINDNKNKYPKVNNAPKTTNGVVSKKPSPRNTMTPDKTDKKPAKTVEPTQKTYKPQLTQKTTSSSTISSRTKSDTRTSKTNTEKVKTKTTETVKSKPILQKDVEPTDSDTDSLPDSLNESVYSSLNDISTNIQKTKIQTCTTEHIKDIPTSRPTSSIKTTSEENEKTSKVLRDKKVSTKSVFNNRGATVDLQRSISSREATPDRMCPLPVTSDDGAAPRYPDQVVEPDDGTPRRRFDKLFETSIHEYDDTIQSKKIVEIKEDKNRRVSQIDRVDNDDDSLLTVDRKINKFLSTAEKLTEKPIVDISQPAPKVERPKFEVNDDLKEDDCLLSVSDKVQKFITEAEHLTTQKDSQHRKSFNIEVKSDVSNKINKFTVPQETEPHSPRKLSTPKDVSSPTKGSTREEPTHPERREPVFLATLGRTKLDQDVFITTECSEIEKEADSFRTSKRPSQPEVTKHTQDEFKSKKTFSNTKEKTSTVRRSSTVTTEISDDDSEIDQNQDSPTKPRQNSVKEFTPKNRRPSQEDKVILSSVGRLRSNESIKKAKALFENTESMNREEKRQKDILNRPSVFEGRSKTVKETNSKKNIDRNSITPKRLVFSEKEPNGPEASQTPGYMKPLDRSHQHPHSQTPQEHPRNTPRHSIPDDDRDDTPGYMKPLDRSSKPQFDDIEISETQEHQHHRTIHRDDHPDYMKPQDRSQRPQFDHLEKSNSHHTQEHHKTIHRDDHPDYMKPQDRSARPQFDHIEKSNSHLTQEHHRTIHRDDHPDYMKPQDRSQRPQFDHLEKTNSHHTQEHHKTIHRDDHPYYMKPQDRSARPQFDHIQKTDSHLTEEHHRTIHRDDHPDYMKPQDRSARPQFDHIQKSDSHLTEEHHRTIHRDDHPDYMNPQDRSARPQFDHIQKSNSHLTEEHHRTIHRDDHPDYMKPQDRSARPQFDHIEKSNSHHTQEHHRTIHRDDHPDYMKPQDRSARPQFDHIEKTDGYQTQEHHRTIHRDDHPDYMKPQDHSARPEFDHIEKSDTHLSKEHHRTIHRDDHPDYMKPQDRSARPQFDHIEKTDSYQTQDHHRTIHREDHPDYMKPLDRTERPQFDKKERSKSPKARLPSEKNPQQARPNWTPENSHGRPESQVPGYMKPIDRSHQHLHKDTSRKSEVEEHPRHPDDDHKYRPVGDNTPGYMRPLDRSTKPQYDQSERERSPESRTSERHIKSVDHERHEKNVKGDMPGYMKSLDRNERNSRAHSPKKDVPAHNKPKEAGTPTKFGVTLKRTDSNKVVTTSLTTTAEKKHPLLTKKTITEEEIEEVYDLEVLEELLLKFTIYELRRKIRNQIRIVKKLISENKLEITIRNLKNKSKTTDEVRVEERNTRGTTQSRKIQENHSINKHEVSEYKVESSRKESVSSTTVSEYIDTRRSKSPEKKDRKASTRRTPEKQTPERSSPERRFSTKSVTEKNSVEERTTTSQSTYNTKGRERTDEPTSTKTTSTNIFKSSLKKTEPKSKTPTSAPQPEWITQRNLKKTGTNEIVKKSSVSSSSSSIKKQQVKSSSTQDSEATDLIQSSYGIGPTDENGAPLFGLRALRAQKTNGTTKVQGTVISSQYYEETGKEPVGQISFTKYSSDPRDLGVDEDSTTNGDILSVTTTQKYGYDDAPSLDQLTSTKKEICDSQSNKRKNSTKSSTITRKNSVKALTQKFVENAVEVSKNERQSSYPKAGLILRSSSFKNESAVDDEYNEFSAEERTESVSVKSSNSKTVSGGTFLRNRSKVSGVQDAITRMKAEDVEYGDTKEDIEAKDLLNKYLGTQVILSGIEGQVSRTGTSSTKASSFSTSSKTAKSTSRITTVTMENGKEVTRTLTFEHPVSDEVLETVWDEQTLRYLLDQSTDYEERKRIRARLRLIMAEQEACTELVKQASQDQSSQSIDESMKTSKEIVSEGPITTTKVTKVSTQQHISKKPMSPFAKFRQLDKQNSLNTPPSTPRTPGGSPLFKFTDAALSQSASTIKDRLLYWCRMKTKEYENIQLDNFSSSWADGLAFCALIHHFLPEAFDYHELTPKERRHNFELAFKVADEKADIAPLLDVDDMVATMRPDWKCVFTYVQSIYRRFKDED